MIRDFHESVIRSEEVMDTDQHHVSAIEGVTLRETLSEHIDATTLEGFGVMTEADRLVFLYGDDLSDAERQRVLADEAGMLIVMAEMQSNPKSPCSRLDLDEDDEERIVGSQQSTVDGAAVVPTYSYRSVAQCGKIYLRVIQYMHLTDFWFL